MARGSRLHWPGTTRTDLQRHDLSVGGRETIPARIDFEPSSFATRHKHPGEEIIYVLEGTREYASTIVPLLITIRGNV